MISDPTDGLSLSYDPENRITGASGYTYTYDADGNRVKKANGTTGTLYWYMAPGIVAESNLSGNLKSEYVFFNGERIARRDFGTPSGVFYYFADHLKTASVITDSAGNIKAESDYYPWGGELQFTNSDTNHYKFTGKERDAETGLDYFGARYYSNGLGRFLTPDWAAKATAVPYAGFADPQSLNLYTYVRNIPTVNADPDGHKDNPALLGPIIISPQDVQNALDKISSIATGLWDASGTLTGMPTMPTPNPDCSCSGPQQENDDKNKNNSKSENQNEKGGQGGEKRGEPSQLTKGKEAHKNEEVRPGEKAEVRTPSGRRMDRYNDTDGHIREIKPDNERGRKAGQKQLTDYKQEMDKATGKNHTTELTTYDNN